jgi:hypothetical protein
MFEGKTKAYVVTVYHLIGCLQVGPTNVGLGAPNTLAYLAPRKSFTTLFISVRSTQTHLRDYSLATKWRERDC